MSESVDTSGGYDEYAFVAEFYDYVGPYDKREDVRLFVDLARGCGGSVLEVGCGTGRVLIPIAREGIEIVGLDLSSRMLDICRRKLAAEPAEVGSRVQLIEGDMRIFDLGRGFDLITIPFRSFQHLTSLDDQIACLMCIHSHLKEHGLFVLDLYNPSLPILVLDEYMKEGGDEPEFLMPDGRKVVRKHRIARRDYYNQISSCEIIYYVTHRDGRTERLVHEFEMRYLFRFEAEHLLARCGFRIEELLADYEKAPYGSKYPGDLIFIAKKM